MSPHTVNRFVSAINAGYNWLIRRLLRKLFVWTLRKDKLKLGSATLRSISQTNLACWTALGKPRIAEGLGSWLETESFLNLYHNRGNDERGKRAYKAFTPEQLSSSLQTFSYECGLVNPLRDRFPPLRNVQKRRMQPGTGGNYTPDTIPLNDSGRSRKSHPDGQTNQAESNKDTWDRLEVPRYVSVAHPWSYPSGTDAKGKSSLKKQEKGCRSWQDRRVRTVPEGSVEPVLVKK